MVTPTPTTRVTKSIGWVLCKRRCFLYYNRRIDAGRDETMPANTGDLTEKARYCAELKQAMSLGERPLLLRGKHLLQRPGLPGAGGATHSRFGELPGEDGLDPEGKNAHRSHQAGISQAEGTWGTSVEFGQTEAVAPGRAETSGESEATD